jgi:phage portal protein BeeE
MVAWPQFLKLAPRRERDHPSSANFNFQGKKATITYVEAISAELAMAHPVLYRCVNKIATSVQSVKWMAAKDDTAKGKKITTSQLSEVQEVLDYPNDNMTAQQLRYWLALSYASSQRVGLKAGFGAVEKKLNGIYPLDPAVLSAIFNAYGTIIGFEFGTGVNKQTFPSRARAGEGNDYAFHFQTPNLQANLSNGKVYTPLKALGLPAEVINLLLRRAIDTAGGHPNTKYVVVAERSLTNDQKSAIVQHLQNMAPGDDESGQVLTIYNTKVEIHKLDNNLNDIHSKVPLDDMARMIAGVYGIPVSLLGLAAADGAKFAGNYIESRRSFWEDTIIPGYLEPIGSGLAKGCLPEGMTIEWDLDSIEALRDVRTTRAKELTLVTFLEQNEKRDLCGFGPLSYELAPAVPGVMPNKPSKPKTTKSEEDDENE